MILLSVTITSSIVKRPGKLALYITNYKIENAICMKQSKHWYLVGLFHAIIKPHLKFNTASIVAIAN